MQPGESRSWPPGCHEADCDHRYRAASQAGFTAVEVAHPYNEDVEDLAAILKENGLKQVSSCNLMFVSTLQSRFC